MKRRILSIFSLILILLVSCTILSAKIEEESVLDAISFKVKGYSFNTAEVPASALFYDEDGYHLYGVYEGKGWEAGMRIEEISPSKYTYREGSDFIYLTAGKAWRVTKKTSRDPNQTMTIDWHIIRNASRQPVVGELVDANEQVNLMDDTYLVVYPDGIERIPEYSSVFGEIIATSDNAILVKDSRSITPFMEANAKEKLSQFRSENWRIYSISEIDRFQDSMTFVVIAALLLLFVPVLWGISCFLAKKGIHYKKYVWLNVGICVVLMFCMALAIQKVDLPSSLLPSDHIFNFKHYLEEFSMISDAYKALGMR